MIERDKIINIVEQNKYCDVNTGANCRECKYSKELENYKDMGCSSLKTADALIAAGIGDVRVAERALQEACRYIDSLGESCACCMVREEKCLFDTNCDFLTHTTEFFKRIAEREIEEEGKNG